MHHTPYQFCAVLLLCRSVIDCGDIRPTEEVSFAMTITENHKRYNKIARVNILSVNSNENRHKRLKTKT